MCWFARHRAATVGATVLAPLPGHPLRGLLPSVVGGYHEKWPIRASLRPLGVYIYAFGSQSCATRLIFAGSAPLGPTKLRFCAKTLFLGAFRSAFGFAPQNATRFSAVTRPRPWPRMAPLVEFGAVLGVSASHTSSDRLRRLGLRPRVIPRSLRRRSRRLHGDTRRNASSVNTPPRLAMCLTAHPTNRVAACRSVRHSPPRPLPHLP